MRDSRVWAQILSLQDTTVESVDFDDLDDVAVVRVRLHRGARNRCGRCRRRSPRYDLSQASRRWRALDLGVNKTFIETALPRVSCPEHGVVVAAVPWAAHDAGHTRAFDQMVTWLAVRTSKSATAELMRTSWRTVGHILDRQWAHASAGTDLLADLRRIGIDEISYKRGHKYLTIVVDHDTRRLIWATEGRSAQILATFFILLGPARCAQITHVSADGADWIRLALEKHCRNAVRCMDPFHVVKWAGEALDTERRRIWHRLRTEAKAVKHHEFGQSRAAPRTVADFNALRWALRKNPDSLTDVQAEKLRWAEQTHPHLFEAYRLKEGLRLLFTLSIEAAYTALGQWIEQARNSNLPSFRALARRVMNRSNEILDAIEHRLSNGLIESTNTKIRVLTRIAFGFHSATPVIALAMHALGPIRPELPGRKPTQ